MLIFESIMYKVFYKNNLRMYDVLKENRYLTLLISTVLLLFGQMFAPNSWGIYPKTILLVQHGLVGFWLFFDQKYLRYFFSFFFIILIVSFIIDILNPVIYYKYFGLFYVLYFIVLSTIVFKIILKSKSVNREMLAAVMCGFLLLIIAASLIFITIEIIEPNSFSNLSNGAEKLNDLRYFSFVSILTVGFGDIAPITSVAKSTTAFLCLIGHFYTVIVTGIFIGKYINKNTIE